MHEQHLANTSWLLIQYNKYKSSHFAANQGDIRATADLANVCMLQRERIITRQLKNELQQWRQRVRARLDVQDGNLEDLEGEAREVHKRISHTLPTLDTHSGKLTRKDQTLFCLWSYWLDEWMGMEKKKCVRNVQMRIVSVHSSHPNELLTYWILHVKLMVRLTK